MPSSILQYTVRYRRKDKPDEIVEQPFMMSDYDHQWERCRDAALLHGRAVHELGHGDVTVRMVKDKVIHTFGNKSV